MANINEETETRKEQGPWPGTAHGPRDYTALFARHILNQSEHGDEIRGCCPFHKDDTPSWSGNHVTGLWKCHGCEAHGNADQFAERLGDHVENSRHRTIEATYDYTDEAGNLLYQSVRYEPKDFRQRRPDGKGGWLWNLKDTRRVLYRLPEILPAETVYIVEGEKDVERLRALGLVATTNPGGAGKWREEYNHSLAGKHVVLLPDNDEVGEQHALHVASSLLLVAVSLKIVRLPDLSLKGDVSDWLNAGHTKEELLALVAATETVNCDSTRESSSEAPRPLKREVPPPDPFPLAALATLAAPTLCLSKTIQAPLALCGSSILAAATLGVQAYRNIIIDGRVIPLSENFLTIGESGERKSAVDQEALRPHRMHEKQLSETYESLSVDYENDLASYKKTREDALKKAKTRAAKKMALEAVGLPPHEPLTPILLTEEPTYEGIIKLFLHGQPSLGLFSDDGGRMIGGYGMSDEQQLKTVSGLCELWDGKRVSRVRAGEGAALLYGRRLATHLMAQPKVALRLLSNPLILDQGYLSRCLTVYPTSTAGTRAYREVNLRTDVVMEEYGTRMRAILQTPLPLAEGKRNELNPPLLPLSAEAKALWIRFHDAIETQLADDGPLSAIRGFANKTPEHALRLAGVLTLYEDLTAPAIPITFLGAGITLAQHYLSEALRLFNASQTDPDLLLAEKLLTWAQERGEYAALADIYQRGPNMIRDTATARRLVKILEDHGWFVPVPGGKELDGQFRREVWEVKK